VQLAGISPKSTLIPSRFRAALLSFLSDCRRMLGTARIKDNAVEEASGKPTAFRQLMWSSMLPPGCLWGAL
jgi:hypothetical protein